MENTHYPFVNLPLPYAYDALEPFIDEQTMHLHHDKHLQTYIDNLNAALKDQPRLQRLSLEQLLQAAGSLPQKTQTAIRRNAGGVYNHRFFFDGLSPDAASAPRGALERRISRQFGSFQAFRSEFKAAALSVFGSGYAWLISDACGHLRILTTANQDSPVSRRLCPVLTIDVWEHAYYLKHHNLRGDYIDDWFRVVNWEQAQELFLTCTGR